MFRFGHAQFRYEPYPIGLVKPVIDDDLYASMLRAFPPPELFFHMEDVGDKYSLSEKFNAPRYHDWVRQHPVWRSLYDYLKSPTFVTDVLGMLRDAHIDIGYAKFPNRIGKQIKKMLKDARDGAFPRPLPNLTTRFEFAMLPAQGGFVTPHTDNPDKVVTLVVSMAEPGRWDQTWGGGTDVNRLKDPTLSYDAQNKRHPGLDDVETLHTFAFEPNQAVVFVKTFNSWHSVKRMTCPDPSVMRRTLTINIEAVS